MARILRLQRPRFGLREVRMQFVAYKYNCTRFFSKQHGFPLASYNSSSAHTFMSWGSGTADCCTEQLTITTTLQLRTKYLVHPTVVTLSTSKLCSNNGKVTYQLYSYVLIRNIRSGAEVAGQLMFVLHLVLKWLLCHHVFFINKRTYMLWLWNSEWCFEDES